MENARSFLAVIVSIAFLAIACGGDDDARPVPRDAGIADAAKEGGSP